MELNLQTGTTIQVADRVFAQEFNEALVHQITVAYLAGARSGTKAQKTRAEVSGGGIKPWRQKWTGRARAGTTRSPIWRTGGVTFAAKPRDFSQKVNRKMYQGAMRAIFSELHRQNRLVIVEQLILEAPKTKLLTAKLKDMGLRQVLIVLTELNDNIVLASRNLHKVNIVTVSQLNPVSLIGVEKVIMTVESVRQVEEWLK